MRGQSGADDQHTLTIKGRASRRTREAVDEDEERQHQWRAIGLGKLVCREEQDAPAINHYAPAPVQVSSITIRLLMFMLRGSYLPLPTVVSSRAARADQ